MQYVKYVPSYNLRDFVECYYVWHAPSPKDPIRVDTPPNAFAAIVFNLAESHSVSLDHKTLLKLPSSFISGQSIRNYSLMIESKVDQVGIVFKPTGLYHLFGLQMFEFTNTREDLHEVLGKTFLNVEEKLMEATSDQARIDLLENLILKRLALNGPVKDGVDAAANAIINNYGTINIGALVTSAYMSRRKFERHFLKRVGLSPKYYARIRRYGYLCSLVAGERAVSWSELLYQAGYYDQSHFIKDFKEFSGTSPSQYLETNKELAHVLKSE